MIFRAPEPRLEIPEVPLTPFLLDRAASYGEKPAFIDGPSGRTLTHAGWASAVRRVATGLARRGLCKGDVFAIFSPNLPEYAVAFHAVSLAGGVVTTINPLYTIGELIQQLKDSRARYLLTVPPCVAKAEQAARELGLRELFVFGEADPATPFASLLNEDDPPNVTIEPREDVAALPYSSGTTGLPKGVMLTHYNLVANLLQAHCTMDLSDRDTMLGLLPFFHIYGMTVIMNLGLHAGATVVTLPRFDLEQCLDVLQNHRVSYAPVVPPVVLALAKHPTVEKYDLRSLRTLMSGAAPLRETIAMAASARLGCQIRQGYGLTETSPVTHVARAGSLGSGTSGVGQPVPNTEVKIIDTNGRALGPKAEGEICIRGPQVMKGYLNRPDATSAMIDAYGWLHTGDLGYAAEDGSFYIVDRLKELIKYKGMQIAPAEIEAVLLGHPLVADAAVVPVPDDEAGQIPKGFVVLKGDASAEQIMGWVADRVAPYKKLRRLEITTQIPRSPSGKILRRVLVEREHLAST